MTCIIVDDEPNARTMLAQLLAEHCPEVQVLDTAKDIPTAVKAVLKHQPQIIFLDIEMPVQNGFALFDYFDEPTFETIFCTAYSEYAIRAFEVNALDYILKPIDIQKLKTAVEKAQKRLYNTSSEQISQLKQSIKTHEINKIALPLGDAVWFVSLDDIIYFEADGAYTHVHTTTRKVLVSKKIKEFETMLQADNRFFRTHRSYMIHIGHVQNYVKRDGAFVEFAQHGTVPVARERVKEFDVHIAAYKL